MIKHTEKLANDLAFMSYFKPVYLSALTGKRMDKLMKTVDEVYENNSRRLKTGDLNNIIQDAVFTTEPPAKNGKRLRIYYATQTSVNPPTIVLFVNDGNIMTDSYLKFLENYIRKSANFEGTPIKIVVKNKMDNADLPK